MNLTIPWKASTDNSVNGVTGKLDDIRHALSQEAERLAEVASQYGSEAGSQASKLADSAAGQAGKAAKATSARASDVAQDPVGSASNLAQQLVKGAAELGTAIAVSSRRTAADLQNDAQAVAQDLRRVRITTEPKKTGPDFAPGLALLGGFGAGLALMYFFDPVQGKRRRAMLRDQLLKWTRVTTKNATGKAKDLSNRAQGAAIEAKKAALSVTGASTDQAADAETQAWGTGYSNGNSANVANSDPSTTDTWGEQPQSAERIEIS